MRWSRGLRLSYLSILRLGNIDERHCSGVDDLETLHDGGAVIRDDHFTILVDQLIHSTRAQRAAHNVGHSSACIHIADELRLALRRVRPLLEENDRGLHAPDTLHHVLDKLRAAILVLLLRAVKLVCKIRDPLRSRVDSADVGESRRVSLNVLLSGSDFPRRIDTRESSYNKKTRLLKSAIRANEMS